MSAVRTFVRIYILASYYVRSTASHRRYVKMSAYVKTGNCNVLKCQMETFWLIISLIVTTVTTVCPPLGGGEPAARHSDKNRKIKKRTRLTRLESSEAF